MKIVLVSNYLNHHQIPLCEEFIKRTDEFYFIATDSNYCQGFQNRETAPYVVEYSKNEQTVYSLVKTADAVIFGSCPDELIKMRMDINKLSFLYSERFFKKGTWRRMIPHTYHAVENRIGTYRSMDSKMYVLCASAFLPYDISLFKFPLKKIFRWGYFPEVRQYDNLQKLIDEKDSESVLWVGRFLDWKHPLFAAKIVNKLKNNNYNVKLTMVGDGPQKQLVDEYIRKHNLSDTIITVGTKNADEVRSYMEKSNIFLFTSDRREGWGAVLNEALNSACIVVANSQIGSVPYLLKHGENGFTYKNGHSKETYRIITDILKKSKSLNQIRDNAYNTISSVWNAEMAAERLISLCANIEDGVEFREKSGPCSKAEIIKG